jgi:hypothetical protein
MNGKRHPGIGSIYGAGGSIDKMFDPMLPTPLQNVHEPYDIAVNVCIRVLEGVAHARLACKIDDDIKAAFGKEILDSTPFTKRDIDEAEPLAPLQELQPIEFQVHIVIVIQIVEANDLVSAVEEPF